LAGAKQPVLSLTMIDLPGDLDKARTILLPDSPDKRGHTRSLDQARVAGRQEARDGGSAGVDGMGREWGAGSGGGAGEDEFWWCGRVAMLACSRVSSARLWMIRERTWARRQWGVSACEERSSFGPLPPRLEVKCHRITRLAYKSRHPSLLWISLALAVKSMHAASR
jgi:hypothetical protein